METHITLVTSLRNWFNLILPEWRKEQGLNPELSTESLKTMQNMEFALKVLYLKLHQLVGLELPIWNPWPLLLVYLHGNNSLERIIQRFYHQLPNEFCTMLSPQITMQTTSNLLENWQDSIEDAEDFFLLRTTLENSRRSDTIILSRNVRVAGRPRRRERARPLERRRGVNRASCSARRQRGPS